MKAGKRIFFSLLAIIFIIAGTGVFTFVTVNGQISPSTRIILIALYLVSIGACLLTGLVFVRNVMKGIAEVSKLSERVANGDFDFDIGFEQNVEHGLAPFKTLKKNIMGIESETSRVWKAIESGNLNARTDSSIFSGEFLTISNEFNEIMDKVVNRMHWYESILDAVPFPIHVTDENMNWVFINKPFEKLMVDAGVIKNRKEGYGKPCCTANANICNTEGCGIKQLLKGNKESYFDWCGMHCKQDTNFLKDRNGKNIGYIETVTDLTPLIRGKNFTKEAAKKLEENLRLMAQGHLDLNYTVPDGDQYTTEERTQFVEINRNFEEAVRAISGYIQEIKTSLGKIAEGDLQNETDFDFKGDFSEIKDSLIQIVRSLNDVLSEINIAAEQVSTGSSQVSDGSQALSQGATEQASAIEELTSSVTEIAAKTRENAQAASEANHISEQSRENANEGSRQMGKLLQSMNEIEESSNNISKIVKVIDDIAFQTNMLALNAAVEAARAGQYGKGFAVVAEEVRNLAARSSGAVKETTSLIENSMQKTEAGLKIAGETSESFKKIVEGAQKSAELVSEIATYSNEQATGITQINKGLEQVAEVVQKNSATSEESAASSEELSSQAALLKQMINRFKLKGNKAQGRQTGGGGSRAMAAASSERRISLSDIPDKY